MSAYILTPPLFVLLIQTYIIIFAIMQVHFMYLASSKITLETANAKYN